MNLPPPAARRSFLANALGFLGSTFSKAGDGIKRYSGSFTPVAGAKPPRSLALQGAGSLPAGQAQSKIAGPEQQFDTSLYPVSGPTAASLDPVGSPIRQPIKTETDISAQRVQQYLLARFNPIRGLSPRLLSTYLEQYDLGFLRQMSLVWHKIKERDDQIAAVVESREVKPADMSWEITQTDESPEATQHKQALEDFYNGISVSHALDKNQRGGVQLLLKMMMQAVGDKFAPFEIVWRPETDRLTAEIKYVPVWFFENRTGELRFLPYELALQGVPLEAGGWMVHVGKGLFAATSICYLYKQMGLKTWVNYQEKFGIPYLHAKTNAEFESSEWNGLQAALQNFGSDGGIVTKLTTEIEAIIMGSQGAMPHEPFVDRMDRSIARIWRGGDLSSMSKGGGAGHSGGGVGALPQMENESALAKTDAEMLSETCQFYLDRWVIRYRFGDDVMPKAKFCLQPPQQIDTDREIKVDQFLLSAGVPQAVSDLLERYGRNMPSEGDVLAHAPAAPAFGGAAAGGPAGAGGGGAGQPAVSFDAAKKIFDPDKDLVTQRKLWFEKHAEAGLANVAANAPGMRRFVRTAADLQAAALAKSLQPLRTKLAEVAGIEDPAARASALQALRQTLPSYVRQGVSHELVKVIEDSLGTAVVIGATDASEATGHLHHRERFPLNGHATHHS